MYSLCYYPVTANCFCSSGLRWKTFRIKKKCDAAWPHLAVRIISAGASCTVNWPALRVSGPCHTQKSLRNLQERKHCLGSWQFLTWSQYSCRLVQYEFPYYRALLSCIHLCHPVSSSLSCSNFLLSTSVVVFGWEESASASAVIFLCGMKSPFVWDVTWYTVTGTEAVGSGEVTITCFQIGSLSCIATNMSASHLVFAVCLTPLIPSTIIVQFSVFWTIQCGCCIFLLICVAVMWLFSGTETKYKSIMLYSLFVTQGVGSEHGDGLYTVSGSALAVQCTVSVRQNECYGQNVWQNWLGWVVAV